MKKGRVPKISKLPTKIIKKIDNLLFDGTFTAQQILDIINKLLEKNGISIESPITKKTFIHIQIELKPNSTSKRSCH